MKAIPYVWMMVFSTTSNPFAAFEGKDGGGAAADIGGVFGTFDDKNKSADDVVNAAFNASNDWDAAGGFDALSVSEQRNGRGRTASGDSGPKTRSRSQDHRRARRKDKEINKDETPEEAIDRLAAEDDEDQPDTKGSSSSVTKKVASRGGVRRMASSNLQSTRQSRSSGSTRGVRRIKSESPGSPHTAKDSNHSRRSKGKSKDGDNDDSSDDSSESE